MTGSPASLRNQATMAPKVTSSPCAKLVSPVVPNINERPSAARRQDQPEPHAAGDQLPDLAGLSCVGAALGGHGGGVTLATGVAAGLADTEQHGLVLQSVDRGRDRVGDHAGDVGGQRIGIEHDFVLARPRNRNLPGAVSGGLDRPDLAVVVGDGDGHALDRRTLVPQESADRLGALLVLCPRRPRPDDDDGKGGEEPRKSYCQPAHLGCTSGLESGHVQCRGTGHRR